MKKELLRLVLTTCFAMMAWSANADTVGGFCGVEGDNMITWELNRDLGLLTISGYGRMADFDDPSEAPWYSYSKSIVYLIVEDGITHVAQEGFAFMPDLESAEIAGTVTSIGDNAFQGAPLCKVIPTGWTGETKYTKLEAMNCGGNPIKTLDVSQNTALKHLYCWGNQLTALDLSKNVALTELACHLNTIKGEAIDALIESLPTITDQFLGNWHVIYSNDEGNIITTTQVEAAQAKGWKPMYFDSYWKPYDATAINATLRDKGQMINNARYNLSGQRVNESYKGIIIRNGKKYINKLLFY